MPSPPASPAPPAPPASRPTIIIAEQLDAECAAWLSQRATVITMTGLPREALLARLPEADGLVVRTYTKVDSELLAAGPRLRAIGRAGVGLDNFDLEACRRRNVQVIHTPDANSQAVVELVIAFMLDALRPRIFVDRALPLAEWNSIRKELTAPKQLSELTIGVYGLGRIGSRIARALGPTGLGCRVIYHELLDFPPLRRFEAIPVDRETLLRESDILTIHVDPRPANRHLINAEALALCRPGVILINAARGMLIDAAALAAFLRACPAALAILDVHDPEPFDSDYPLLDLPNARLSPHIAAATHTAHRNMSWVVRDVLAALTGAM